MTLRKILDQVEMVATTVVALIAAAEDLIDGTKAGTEKKAWVVAEASKLLTKHVGPFWATDLAKTILGILIDLAVSLANKAGNLSASPAT
jgi:hypothetical protein